MSVRVEKKRFLVYLSVTLALVGVNVFAITTNTHNRKAKATPTPVRITYPGPDDTVANSFAYIGGTAGANKKVSLFADNTWVGNTDANAAGEWSFKWEDATPGTHNFRATVIDGTGYAGSWWGGSPTQALNLNSGQKETQSSSGFAGVIGMPIDPANNLMFVINGSNSTVSVVNAATRSFVKDIELEPGTNQSLLGFSGQNAVDFGMDTQHQKLFIMTQKSGIIYVVDTAAQTMQTKIQITAADTERMILSPNQDELFVLSSTMVRRIDTQTNTVSNEWATPPGGGAFNKIVYNPANLSFYYSSVGNQTTVFTFSPSNSTSDNILVTANNNVTTIHDLALSQDGSKVSVIYESDSSEFHVATYATADNSLLNDSAQIANDSIFLNKYDVGGNLYMQSDRIDQQVNIRSLNLSDYSINDTIGLEGRLTVSSFSTSDGSKVNTAIDSNNNKLYQITKDAATQRAILNTVDLTNLQSTPTMYDVMSSFIYAPVITLDAASNRLFVDSGSMPDAIVPIDLSDNSLDAAITHGSGNALKLQFNEAADEIYTVGILPSYYLLSRQVAVLDGSSGELKDTIDLPTGAYAANIVMNAAKTKLYIAATLEATGETVIYRADALTHSIDRTYPSYVGYRSPGYIEMRGDNLYLIAQNNTAWNLIKLNVNTDASSTVEVADKNNDNDVFDSSFLPLLGNLFSVSPSGNKAVLQSKINNYTVIDTSTMTIERTVGITPDSASVAGGLGFFIGLIFAGSEDHLYVGSLGLFIGGYIKGFTISYINLASGAIESSFSAAPKLSTPGGQLGFGYVASLALSVDGKTLYSRLNYALASLSRSESAARYKTTQSLTAIDVSSRTAVLKHDVATSQLSSDEMSTASLSINSFMFGASLAVNDQTQSVEQSIKVGGDGIKITSPRKDEQLTEKSPLITGTSPGESVISVSIDGNVLGTTTATKEGKWSIKATALSAGSHSIHAEYGRDKKNNLYIGQFGLFGLLVNALDLTQEPGIIDVFDTDKETFSGKIALPNGGISYFSKLSTDGKYLLVYGLGNILEAMINNQQPSINLWLVDTKTNKVTKTFQFDTASWQGGEDVGVTYMLSPDNKELIAARADKIVVYDTEKLFASGKTSTLLPGAIIREVDLPPTNNTVFSDAVPPNMLSRLVQNGKKLVVPYYHQIATVDLASGSVVTIGEVENRETRSVYVNDARNEAYIVGTDTSVQTDGTTVTIINTLTGQVKNVVTIPGSDFYIIGSLSADKQNLRMYMSNNNSGTKVVSLNVSTQSISTSQDVPIPSYYTDKVNELLSYSPEALNNGILTIPYGIGFNAEKTKIYSPTILFGLAQGDDNALFTSKLFNKNHSYFTIGDDFSGEVPGAKYSDDIGVTLGEATSCAKTNTCPPPPATCVETNTCPVVVPPIDNPAPTARTTLNDIRNKAKPSGLVMLLRRIVAAIRRFTSSLPRTVLEASPFILLILLLAVIASFLYQTSRELKHNRTVNERLAFASLLATEKNNFLQLISHYLRTPLTVLSGGIEMAKTDTPPETHKVLAQSAENLSKTTEVLLEKVENEPVLKALDTTPIYKVPRKDVMRNKYFAVPAIILGTTLGFFYLFFVFIGGVRTTPVNFATQILGLGLTVQLLYGTVHNNLMIKRENARMVALIGFEKRLDAMRSEFIREAQYSIGFSLQKIQELTAKVPNEQYRNYIMKGVNQYNELLRSFRLVTQLENSKVTGVVKPVHVNNAIGDAVKELVGKIQEKKLNVDIAGLDDNPQIRIEPTLLSLTVKALLSNAIDASAEGSNIMIKAHVSRGKVAVSVVDHGVGMSKVQKDALFKPFGRIDDTETFNKEGAGLSLYLSRMILHAFKGDLGIESAVGKGTTASISLPVLK
ncbi:MAG TPA: ATP-binding protein [Candidatus Saccharibacteria bacterium]|nr:ATP-binding protein [Candidatus Saccharibacteria bacterium]